MFLRVCLWLQLQVYDLAKALDRDGDGTIDYNELLAYLVGKDAAVEEEEEVIEDFSVYEQEEEDEDETDWREENERRGGQRRRGRRQPREIPMSGRSGAGEELLLLVDRARAPLEPMGRMPKQQQRNAKQRGKQADPYVEKQREGRDRATPASDEWGPPLDAGSGGHRRKHHGHHQHHNMSDDGKGSRGHAARGGKPSRRGGGGGGEKARKGLPRFMQPKWKIKQEKLARKVPSPAEREPKGRAGSYSYDDEYDEDDDIDEEEYDEEYEEVREELAQLRGAQGGGGPGSYGGTAMERENDAERWRLKERWEMEELDGQDDVAECPGEGYGEDYGPGEAAAKGRPAVARQRNGGGNRAVMGGGAAVGGDMFSGPPGAGGGGGSFLSQLRRSRIDSKMPSIHKTLEQQQRQEQDQQAERRQRKVRRSAHDKQSALGNAGMAPEVSRALQQQGSAMTDMLEFLHGARLDQFGAALQSEYGAACIGDLASLDARDLGHIGMKSIEQKRLMRQVERIGH